MTFTQKSVDGKRNELTAVQELIEQLEISGCIVVANALNCQKKTARAIIAGSADYLLCAKDNQQTLKKDIADYCKTRFPRKAWTGNPEQRKAATGLKNGPPISQMTLNGFPIKMSGRGSRA